LKPGQHHPTVEALVLACEKAGVGDDI
jgi:hypothetical protein